LGFASFITRPSARLSRSVVRVQAVAFGGGDGISFQHAPGTHSIVALAPPQAIDSGLLPQDRSEGGAAQAASATSTDNAKKNADAMKAGFINIRSLDLLPV
jgi:hypothetical protein